MLFTAMAGTPDFSAMSRSCSSMMARSFQFGRTSICVPGGRTASAGTRASIDVQIRISGPRYLPLLLPSSAALLRDDGQHLAVERIDQ